MREFLDPRAQHARWREARLADGWRYGEVYDEANKVHPNLHPDGYDALPFSERIKDFTFWAVIRGIHEYRMTSDPDYLKWRIIEKGEWELSRKGIHKAPRSPMTIRERYNGCRSTRYN